MREWGERGYDECRNAYISPDGTEGYPYDNTYKSGRLHVQDIAGADNDQQLQEELDAIRRLLDFSVRHEATSARECIWTFNFASGCSKSGIGGISLSDGYRHNATHTNKLFLDYLNAPDYEPGPIGMIMTDYLCVETTTFTDKSLATNGNNVYGKQIIEAIIDNNFRCDPIMLLGFNATPTTLQSLADGNSANRTIKYVTPQGVRIKTNNRTYDLQGR